jgi:hypothetical protein
MKALPYIFGILGTIGFVFIVWAPFNSAFRHGIKAWHPITGFKWWPKESWYIQAIGLLLFALGMVGLSMTMG